MHDLTRLVTKASIRPMSIPHEKWWRTLRMLRFSKHFIRVRLMGGIKENLSKSTTPTNVFTTFPPVRALLNE